MVLSTVVVVDIIDEAESLPIIDLAESPPIDAESVIIVVVAVESTVASSVLGLLWQAANVRVVPINRRANTFFMVFFCYVRFALQR